MTRSRNMPTGVYIEAGAYRATYWMRGTHIALGRYNTLPEATTARAIAERLAQQGYTPAMLRASFENRRRTIPGKEPRQVPRDFASIIHLWVYNPETGAITRNTDAPVTLFTTERHYRWWTGKRKEKEYNHLGEWINRADYRPPRPPPENVAKRRVPHENRLWLRFDGNTRICATRVAWALATGDLITRNFTYRDGDPSNLKLENITPALDTD